MKILKYINKFFIIFFCRCIATAEEDDIKRIIHCSNAVNKRDSFLKKKRLLSKIKKKGFDSFLWGDIHNISCPENLEIGENVHIGNNSYIRAEGGVIIGDNTHISKNFVLYTINHNYEGKNLPYDETFIYKPVWIGKNVWIGMNVCVLPGTIIGDGVIVGMGTVVSGNVPPNIIIASQKWRKIGERNKEHYEYIEQKGCFGGIDGNLYISKHKTLNKIGDIKNSNRSILEVIEIENRKLVKKSFLESDDGRIAFANEKYAYDRLNSYEWYPTVVTIDRNSIVYEFINNEKRLDLHIKSLSDDFDKKNKTLKKIIAILFDLLMEKISHRDFHARNLFYIDDTVKLIDFETISEIKKNVDFFNSYDIVGNQKESPFSTNNMCIFSDSDVAISRIFHFNINSFKGIVEDVLKDRLHKASLSFFTRKNNIDERHNLNMGLIYSTFDLPYLKVGIEYAQRDTKKRLINFGVSSEVIKNKTVLDIGSNIGGIAFEIFKMCPKKIVCLEYDKNKVDISNLIVKIHNFNNIFFYQKDVETDSFMSDFTDAFDVVFCLSLIAHLREKEEFLKKVYKICNDFFFLEGNSSTNSQDMVNLLLKIGFKKVHFIGYSNDDRNKNNNIRPLFICNK
jgi:acetyltransferase-like isoleucine patch superfamily enzyme/2-polyprenyl-3-methyl-5-hydroxy-6-metoxy-1,4-benzoquinol methylase/predicted Ser/Thr protein kinase